MSNLIKYLRTDNLTSYSAIAVGILLVLTGASAIGYYILVIIEALDNVDRSGIYWLLPFAFIGIFLILLGVYFLFIGFKSRRDKNYQPTAFVSLIALGLCVTLLFTGLYVSEYSADKVREEMMKEEAMLNELQRLTSLSILEANTEGLTVSVATHGFHSGNYTLHLRVFNSQANFWESFSTIELNLNENEIVRHFSFDDVFRKCSGEFKNSSSVYVCVNNAGTRNTKFIISAKLTSDEFINTELASSILETSISLDTFTQNHTVFIQKVVRGD
jgi:hypothetical protein